MSAAPRPPADLLERPTGEGARLVALAELARAGRARAALTEGSDPEALHDFRVAVRRLRSQLRAFRGELEGAVGRKLSRRLRRIAAGTNPGRDAEVGIALLDELARGASPAEKRAAGALGARLAERRDEVYRRVEAELLPAFDAVAARLHERLASWQVEVRLDGAAKPLRPFRAALGAELGRHAASLLDALDAARDGSEARAVHRARIAAKRLRYLLEPVAPALEAAREPVRRLRQLQDLLGDARDLGVLATELAVEAADAEHARIAAATGGAARTRSAGGRAGRAALARRLAERRSRLEAELGRRWLAAGAAEAAALASGIAALVEALADAERTSAPAVAAD